MIEVYPVINPRKLGDDHKMIIEIFNSSRRFNGAED
jgi:hypothetical protein